jgi:hypothetical protein
MRIKNKTLKKLTEQSCGNKVNKENCKKSKKVIIANSENENALKTEDDEILVFPPSIDQHIKNNPLGLSNTQRDRKSMDNSNLYRPYDGKKN